MLPIYIPKVQQLPPYMIIKMAAEALWYDMVAVSLCNFPAWDGFHKVERYIL